MDELYFEEGYVTSSYFVYVANATSGFTPYIAEGYLPTDFFEDRGAFASLYCDAEIVVGMLLEAQAYFDSEFAFTAAVNRVADTSIALTSSFTQTAVGTRGKDIDLFAFSDAAIAVSVDRIRDNNVAASIVFDVATDFVVERSADADVDAIFSAIINGLRSRDNSIETQAAFSFDLTPDLFKDFASVISAEASVSVNVQATREFDSSPSAEFTQSASGNRIRFGVSDITSTAAVDATARKIRDAHLTGTGVAAISCAAVKNVGSTSTLESQSSIAFLGGKLKTYQASLPVYASVFVSRNVGLTKNRPFNLEAYPGQTLTFDNSIKKFGSASLSSSATYSEKPTIPTFAEDFYIETWIYWPTGNGSGTTISTVYFIQVAVQSTNKLRIAFQIPTSINSYPSQGYIYLGADNSFSRDTWHHIAIVKTQTSMSYYLDGARVYYTGIVENIPDGFYGPNNGNYWGSNTGSPPQTKDNLTVTGTNARVDELLFVRNSTYGYSPLSTTIDVPTQARVNSSDVQYLYHFDNNAFDDLSLIQTANSAIISTATLTSAIGGVFNITANISSQSSVTAVVGTLEDINLVAFTDAAVTAVGAAVRASNVAALVEASVSADGVAIRDGASSQSGNFASETSANRIRFGAVSITGSFAQSTDAVKTADISSALSSVSSVAAVIGTLEDINLVAFTNAAVNTIAVKTASGAGAVTSAFTQASVVVKTANTSASIASEFSQSADNSRTRDANATFSALASTVTLANEFEGASANLSSRFYTTQYYIEEDYYETGYYQQFEINAGKIASGVAALDFTAVMAASIRTDVFVAMTTTSSASVTADVVKTTDVVVLEVSESTLSSIVSKTTAYSSTISASFTIFCNGVTAGEINLVAFSNASVSATAEANKSFSSSLSTAFTVYAYTQDSLNSVGSADISSEFSSSISANYIAYAVIQTDAIASSLTVAVKDVAVDTVCEINAILSADAQRTRSTAISATSISVLAATAVKITDISADFENQANIEANVVKVVSASITTEAVASNLTAVVRLAGLFIECLTSTTMVAAGTVKRSAVSALVSTVSAVIDANKLINVSAQITTFASLSAVVGKRKQFAAVITSALTFVVEVRELRLEEILYVIPGENWNYVINSESRNHSIYGETRVRKITGESRNKTIVGESRIHILD